MNRKTMTAAAFFVLGCGALAWAATEAQENLRRMIDQVGNAPLIAQAEGAPEAVSDPAASTDALTPDAAATPAAETPATPGTPAPAVPAEPPPAQPNLDDLLGATPPETPATPAEVAPGEAAPAPAAEVVTPPPAEAPAAPAAEAPAEAAPAPAPAAQAKDDSGSGKDLDTAEVIRRQAQEIEGLKQLTEAEALLNRGEYDKAEALFEQALSKIPERAATDDARKKAIWGLGEAAYLQADALYGRISYSRDDLAQSKQLVGEIEKKLAIALRDEEGHGAKARRMQRRLKSADESLDVRLERPIPPKYREDHVTKVRTNKQLLDEGRLFFELEDYDKAEANFTQILRNDPYHRDAMRFLRRIEERRLSTSSLRRRTTRVDMIQDVTDRWNPPIRSVSEAAAVRPQERPTRTGGGGARLLEKMQSTIIPSIEFRQANIVDVITFLREASEEQDPQKVGVNIILKLDGGAATSSGFPTAPAEAPAAPVDVFAAPGPETAAEAPAAAAPSSATVPITLTLRRVTLLDAIRYVTDVANLKYRVEETAVIITPQGTVDNVVTRLYPVQPNIIEITSTQAKPEEGTTRNEFVMMGTSGATMDRNTDMKRFFEQQGVPFPPGTSIAYNQQISQLIVRNTPENLEILERIIQQLDVIPKQVEIEARFVEVAENDLQELGLEWLLTDNWEIARQKGAGPLETSPRIVMGANDTGGGFSRGLRFYGQTGAGEIPSGMARSATTASSLIGNIATLSGVLTNPELSVVLHALEQKGALDVLSCPRVTTKSGVNAFIKVVEEIIYPTEFQEQSAGQIVGGFNQQLQPGETANAAQLPSRPPYPSTFETREVGVILNVTPIVGPDGQTVDLTLVPEVAELARWIDYGPAGLYPLLQPVFSSRNVTTSVTVWDGQTIVMGGLIKEVQTTIDDRIPILGDIPLLGRLFRNEGHYNRKQNLMIFVTAKIVDPAGNPLRRGGTNIAGGGTTETPPPATTEK